ncbi:MAG: dihydroorotase [Muribaculaceae bacterium]|nr:dihydroorotase [Muribaculaceae bacterium]
MGSVLLKNAVITNRGKTFRGYIGVRGAFIAEVSEGEPSPDTEAGYDEVRDLDGARVIPGVIDDQVHFRDPGLTHKGDIKSESRAALAGGVTSFMDMPNTNPQTVTLEALADKHATAEKDSAVNWSFFLGATNDNLDVLRSAPYFMIPGIKVFLGSSTGNMLVNDDKQLDAIFSLGRIVAVHSEDEAIIARNTAIAREKYGDDVPVAEHPNIRSREACVVSTRRAIERARRLDTRLHLLHLSTADETAMLSDIPLEEKKITAEVCAHHLWFCDEDYARLGAKIKCNPAVKTRADRDALRAAVNDGCIDIVATDHAPHLPEEKQGGALKAASGLPLVQFSLPMMLEMAKEGIFTVEKVVNMMCHRPATLYGIDRRGFLDSGCYADITIVRETPFEVTPEIIQSKCKWSPLEGHRFPVTVEEVLINGATAWRAGEYCEHLSMPLRYK